MAFDQPTRNRLQRFVSDARDALTVEFTRQLQNVYGLDPKDGSVTPLESLHHLDDAGRETARLLRATLEHYRAGTPSGDHREILDRIVREQAFTVLNRLAALRMAEARGILTESVSKGYESKGFQLYFMLVGTGHGERGDAYRSYLFSLFDEFALDLNVLFDRFSPQGRLFPREAALLQLLGLMNDQEVAPLWGEDETIGWIYQYFNSKEERKQMRDASAAPRNSRELAVRNQFFTPRYVVEFLTDNTLGRIWYEMTRGETRLKDECRYLVRRPNEVFLESGESPPEVEDTTEQNLSQEDLLKQPVFIAHRPLKDPRALRVLDPACGSMHFGLYAYDLLEMIYEEAWELEAARGADAFIHEPGLSPLRETYADEETFRRHVPRLIIEHNLHGIDIDPRAVQIAALSLWLRAQRAWAERGVKPAERPQVRRSNIVCAEPMPGEETLLKEFVDKNLSATPELRLLGQLIRHVFDAMKLAGEAGSLLKIETEIADAVAEAKQKWLEAPMPKQDSLFAEMARPEQQRLGFDVAGITDEAFWERAEQLIYGALQSYAEGTENGGGYQRRLFADDAARGFAFIDLCRKHYDVVLMNPPFGSCTDAAKPLVFGTFGRERIELGGCFITRFEKRLDNDGKLGVIANRTLLFAATLDEWRRDHLAGSEAVVDLGHGVLDALVETAAIVIGASSARSTLFVGALDVTDKKDYVGTCVLEIRAGQSTRGAFRRVSEFQALFGSPFAYWAPHSLIAKASQLRPAEAIGAIARQGLATCDNFRFLRLAHELPAKADGWVPLTKGGEYQPFWADVPLRVRWLSNGREVKAYIDCLHGQWSRVVQSTNLYGLPGATYSERTASSTSLRILPRDIIFDKKGPFVGAELEFHSIEVALKLIGLSYTTPYRFLIETSVGLRDATTSGSAARDYLPSMIQRLPWPELNKTDQDALEEATRGAVEAARELAATEEPNGFWHEPLSWSGYGSIQELADARLIWWCGILARIYHHAETLEELGMKIFMISKSDYPALEAIAGRSIFTYERRIVTDVAKLKDLLDLPSEDLIAELVVAGKGHSTIYKKAYWGDRNLELISHLWEVHPLSLLDAIKTSKASPKWVSNTAWRVLSASVGLVFGRIQSDNFFQPTHDVLPDDLFSLIYPATQTESPSQVNDVDIYCDDPGDSADLIQHIERLLNSFFSGKGSEEIGVCIGEPETTLRQVVAQSLFIRHLSIYSDYRRQAPIYWPLSTASGSYTLWLYYKRLSDQTLFSCVVNFVEPKMRQVNELLNHLRAKENRSRNEERELERSQDFASELQAFHDELLRLAQLPWRPDLNDGVQITAAPLWKLFRLPKWQKTLKETWQKLEKGGYDWAHLAMTIWPERVVPKCVKDRSLAIAHGLEDLFWVKDIDGWRKLRRPKQEIEEQKKRQRSDARARVKLLLTTLAASEEGNLKADEVRCGLSGGEWDDREVALLLYPQRVADACWADPTIAKRLNLQLPARRSDAARQQFTKKLIKSGCPDLANTFESALRDHTETFRTLWDKMERGDHDDFEVAIAFWPDRVVDKCSEDVFMAEYHGIRQFFWCQHQSDKWRRREDPEVEVANEVARRRGATRHEEVSA